MHRLPARSGFYCGLFPLLATLLLGATPTLAAQSLSGAVVEGDSRQLVASALVELLAAEHDSIILSAATGVRGRFAFLKVAPGRYRVRILRIGFRPWTSEPLRFEQGAPREEVFAIPAVPVVLSEIIVQGKSPCRGSPQEDQGMALLWDEARTALGLVGAGSPEGLREFRMILTKRLLDPGDHLVSENSFSAFGRGVWPIVSLPPESLASLGFVQPRDWATGPIYFGPDVAVFFSDAFLRTHCFRLLPPLKGESTLVGLGFEPVKGRQVVDIEGVPWLDRNRNLLRRLEYHYTGLWNWVPKRSAGGRLGFNVLPQGAPILTRWSIRAPVARIEHWPEGACVHDESTRPYFGPGKVVLHAFREESGEVQDVRRPDGEVLWRGDRPADSAADSTMPSHGIQHP